MNKQIQTLKGIGLIPFASLLLAVLVLVCLALVRPPQTTTALRGAPSNDDVYFVGNSMFGTGVDIEAARRLMPTETAKLAYYDGQYTATWYAAFRNALLPSGETPKVVIWGFRPTYAVLPAFRQNRKTVLDAFYDADDETFRQILAAAEGRAQNAPALDASTSFFDRAARYAPAIAQRRDIADELSKFAGDIAARGFAPFSSAALEFAADDSVLKIADIIVAFGSGGELRRADALVIDNGERFVSGAPMRFSQSFVPHTALLLRQANIPQLVVIFKPVAVFDGAMPPHAVGFHRDAVAFFEENGVPYLDFLSEDELIQSFYAKGDHYNQDGMMFVTERTVQALYDNGLLDRN